MSDLTAPISGSVTFQEETARTRRMTDKTWLTACQGDIDNVLNQARSLFEQRVLALKKTPSLVAKEMGVSRNYLMGIFKPSGTSGKGKNLTLATLIRVFNHLGVDLALFTKEKGSGSFTS